MGSLSVSTAVTIVRSFIGDRTRPVLVLAMVSTTTRTSPQLALIPNEISPASPSNPFNEKIRRACSGLSGLVCKEGVGRCAGVWSQP
jgi:hypothetical protein